MTERLIKHTVKQFAFYVREGIWTAFVAKNGGEQNVPRAELMRIAEYVVDTHANSLLKSRHLVEDIIDELMLGEEIEGEMIDTIAEQEAVIDKDRALFGVLRDVMQSYVKDEDEIREVLREFFRYLDYTEESDSGRIFRPIQITSCRALMTPKLNVVLDKMKAYAVGEQPAEQTEVQNVKRWPDG